MSYHPLALPAGAINHDRIAAAIEFAEARLRPMGEAWDRGHESPEATLREAIALFTPITIPEKLGGFGESFATQVRVYEELAWRDMGFTCALAVHTNVTVAMSLTPNEALRNRCLPRLLSGAAVGAFLLTELTGGSDASAITTAATATQDGYRVTGHKAWVTNGLYADIFAVFCQTEPGSGAKGVAALVMERDSEGLVIEPALDLIGSTAMGTTDARFEGVAVPAANIAFASGTAFKAAMFGIDVARLGVAAMCNGAAMGALGAAVEYGAARQTFGKSLLDHQGMQWILADTATAIEASRALALQAAQRFDQGEPHPVLTAHAKKYATRTAFEGISEAMRAFGANGLKRDSNLPRQLAAVRVSECMDGTGEIMNVVIGRALRPSA